MEKNYKIEPVIDATTGVYGCETPEAAAQKHKTRFYRRVDGKKVCDSAFRVHTMEELLDKYIGVTGSAKRIEFEKDVLAMIDEYNRQSHS